MNALEAIKIKKTGGTISRKLPNGLTEVKVIENGICIFIFSYCDEYGILPKLTI